MNAEIWIIGATWVASVGAVGGVILQYRRNGKAQADRDEAMKAEQTERDTRLQMNQETIIKRLDDPKEGLSGINEKVNGMVNNCATVSTGLTERVRAAERDISELKQK